MVIQRIWKQRVLTWALGAIVSVAASTAWAQVTARVDRNSLIVGETLTLVLQGTDPKQSLETNLDVLQRDFLILNQRSESQMSIVNGQQSATIRLLVTLEPLRAGTLVIPSLNVAGERTQPITISVDEAPEPAPGEPDPVFIELELNPESGPWYVHAQLGLTLRLYYQQTLTEAAIGQPEVENASVRLLDEVPFQAERNGQRYRVLERRYAIFPERSGTLEIPPMVLTGRLAERDRNRLWQPSGRGRRISVSSEALTVDIQPRPAESAGESWQPARNFRISEQYSATDGIKVGEPVTRTVIIDAVGLEENMLAEPVWPELKDARIYPDQPQGISRDDGEWVLGHKEFRYAVVPEKEGELVLPELSFTWWDTVADEERVATLPARTIQVQPSQFAGVGADSIETSTASADRIPALGQPPGGYSEPSYWRYATLVFAVLWLLTLGFMFVRQRPGGAKPAVRTTDENDIEASFRRACSNNDAAAARRALLRWSQRYGERDAQGRSGLLLFAEACGDEALAESIRELNEAGFSPADSEKWKGATLYGRWKMWKKNGGKHRNRSAPPITDLYAPENRIRASGG